LLDEVLPLQPDNYDLQTARAYFLKNYAMVTRDLKRPEEARAALNEAQLMFQALVKQQPQDTNAWNGPGSVFMLSGHPQEALWFGQRALDLAPDNPYAKVDHEAIERWIRQQTTAAKSHRALVQHKYRLLFSPKLRAKPGPKGPTKN
jgi:hypothetical protein